MNIPTLAIFKNGKPVDRVIEALQKDVIVEKIVPILNRRVIMPIYTYVCKECGENFDLLIGVTAEKVEAKCRKCGSINIEKAVSSFSVGNSKGKSSSSVPSCPTGTCPIG